MNDTISTKRRWYSTPEVMEITGLSESHLAEHAGRGDYAANLRPFRSGRTWRWPAVYVDAAFPPVEAGEVA
ncbi:MAG: helix-turn-helix domain-containing protein [Corynebacterium nuruki]|nr:helix-turn-helix domain-containing protein [Corynebacterium nuruki]